MKLFDAHGQPVEIPDDQAPAALASGDYGLPRGTAVPVRLADGRAGTVPVESLKDSVAAGATILTPAEHAKELQQAKYGDSAGIAKATLAGLARGATLGGSDAAARALGGAGAADALRNLREANPVASTAGEIVGNVAPLLATGGESAAAELAEGGGLISSAARSIGAPARALGAAGEGAEALVTRLLPGAATSLAGRLGARATELAARGGVEGAGLGAADYLSEQSLSQNPELDGQKLLAALGHGALLGAGTGGLLGATGALGSEVLGRLAPHVSALAEESAFRSLSPRKAFAAEADRIPGGARSVGRELIDSGLVQAGDTVDDVAARVAHARQAAGAKIGDILQRADDAGFAGPSLRGIDEGTKTFVARLEALPSLNEGTLGRLRGIWDDVSSYAAGDGDEARLTFRKAQELRSRIDDSIKWATNPLAPHNELTDALKGLRGSIESEVERAGDEASKRLGGDFLAEYQDAKLRYRRLAVADKAASDAVARRESSRLLSASFGAGELGALAGGIGGGSLAHVALGGAAGLASSFARHVLAERGASTAAVVLDRLGALGSAQRAVQSVDRQITRGAIRATGGEAAEMRLRPTAFEGDFAAKRDAIVQAVESADEHASAVERAIAPLATHLPTVAASFQRAAIRSTLYLAQALPSAPTDPAAQAASPQIATKQADANVTPGDKARFDRIFAVVHDPISILARVEEGAITPEEVAAVRATAPDIYSAICTEVRGQLQVSKNPIPYTQRLALSTLLGTPLDATQTAAFALAMQGSPKPAKAHGRPSHPHRKMSSHAEKMSFAKSNALPGQDLSK